MRNWCVFARAQKLHYQCGLRIAGAQRRFTRRSPRVIPHTRVKLCIGRNESEPKRKALLRDQGTRTGSGTTGKEVMGPIQEWRALVERVQRLWPGWRRVSVPTIGPSRLHEDRQRTSIRALTCDYGGGRYWDRTSDLFGVNADRPYVRVPGRVVVCR